MTTDRARVWSEARDNAMRTLIAEGKPASWIAFELCTSVESIYSRARRLGLKFKQKRRLTMSTDLRNQTLIHGTHRPQDLIPVFLDTLYNLSHEAHKDLYYKAIVPSGVDPLSLSDKHPWWDSEDASWLLEDLFDVLNAAAPKGCYLGAHPGNGSDFGFWPVDDEN